MELLEQTRKSIQKGNRFRYAITFAFYVALLLKKNTISKESLYIICVLGLSILDIMDSHFYDSHAQFAIHAEYQIHDKICDILSYMPLLYIFKSDSLLWFFVLYRLIGVCVYLKTKDARYFVLFFDFVKEYLVYRRLFSGYNALMPCVMIKIIYEYHFHKNKFPKPLYLS